MHRDPRTLVLLALSLLALPGEVRAADNKKPAEKPAEKVSEVSMDDWGEPKGLKKGESMFWLWYEKEFWYLRTTGDKVVHRFQGKLTITGGKLANLTPLNGERKGAVADLFVFNKARDEMQFDFRTGTSFDGLNFKPDDNATTLRFEFYLDGTAQKDHIKIGKNSNHPESNVFTVPARPVSKPAETKKPKPKK